MNRTFETQYQALNGTQHFIALNEIHIVLLTYFSHSASKAIGNRTRKERNKICTLPSKQRRDLMLMQK